MRYSPGLVVGVNIALAVGHGERLTGSDSWKVTMIGFALCQPVAGCARMEGLWIQETVCVAVLEVSVDLTVKVSTHVLRDICKIRCTCYESMQFIISNYPSWFPLITAISTHCECVNLQTGMSLMSFTVAACPLTCLNGGTLNTVTCTCDCADGYSGTTCGSECTAWGAAIDASCSRCDLVGGDVPTIIPPVMYTRNFPSWLYSNGI